MKWRKPYYGLLIMICPATALVILLLTGACAPVGEIKEPAEQADGVTMHLLFRSDTGWKLYRFYDEEGDANCWITYCRGAAIDCEPAGGRR